MKQKFKFIDSTIGIVLLIVLVLVVSWFIVLDVFFPASDDKFQLEQSLTEPNMSVWQWFEEDKPVVQKKIVARAKIQAELVGLIYTDERQIAIISTPSYKNKLFRTGDLLATRVYLKSIQVDRVLLDEYGEERELRLLKKTTDKVKVVTNKIKTNKKRPSRKKTKQPTTPTKTTQSKEEGQKLPGAEMFANVVDVLSVRTPDGRTGIKLRSINENVVSLTELKVDDVVVGVNNQSVNQLLKDNLAVTKLLNDHRVNVEVFRDGQPITIEVDVKTLAVRILPLLGNLN